MAPTGFEIYERAPIILAIIQIRYNKIESFDAPQIKGIGENNSAFRRKFPIIKDRIVSNFKIDRSQFNGETNLHLHNQEVNGVTFEPEDHSKLLIIGSENFTYQINGNYPGGEVLIEDMKSFWELFKNTLNNDGIIGMSIRMVNRINLPVTTTDLTDYFTTFIQTTGVKTISSFQFKYTSFEDEKWIYHIGHALEQAIEDSLPYILDIDVIRSQHQNNDDETIWSNFEEIRIKKNEIFNETITDETKSLIR